MKKLSLLIMSLVLINSACKKFPALSFGNEVHVVDSQLQRRFVVKEVCEGNWRNVADSQCNILMNLQEEATKSVGSEAVYRSLDLAISSGNTAAAAIQEREDLLKQIPQGSEYNELKRNLDLFKSKVLFKDTLKSALATSQSITCFGNSPIRFETKESIKCSQLEAAIMANDASDPISSDPQHWRDPSRDVEYTVLPGFRQHKEAAAACKFHGELIGIYSFEYGEVAGIRSAFADFLKSPLGKRIPWNSTNSQMARDKLKAKGEKTYANSQFKILWGNESDSITVQGNLITDVPFLIYHYSIDLNTGLVTETLTVEREFVYNNQPSWKLPAVCIR